MKQLYFVRHGQTEWNASQRMQGRWNSDLSALGRQQAETNGRFLATQGIDVLHASSLGRTRETAAIINSHLALPLHIDERIVEWDCGDWSGELRDDIEARWPAEWQHWQADRYHFRGPNCENYPDMTARVAPFLAEITAAAEANIAVVSHGIIGRVMISQLLGLSETETLAFRQDNDVIYRVTVRDDFREVCHFVGGGEPQPGLTD